MMLVKNGVGRMGACGWAFQAEDRTSLKQWKKNKPEAWDATFFN